MSETVLITGGSGFMGIQLAKDLLAEGHRIVIFDLKPPDSLAAAGGSISFVRGDITDFSQVLNAVRDFRPEVIFHLAAILSVPSEDNPWASISVNGLGTYHILEAARLFDSGSDSRDHFGSCGAYRHMQTCSFEDVHL